ncbi:hypothetical protein J3U66_12475 [Gilliamella sp. B2969]|uniref:hypothetical protein n=1 Tax=Gilliamella sp. B2969 TaxID=2818021 RepID=UPI00226AF055|nr:hypothetical protein [Gilliamella sp. B2969]MCX8731195.1 hypothetical protein [Gilliamella sp. B2969]
MKFTELRKKLKSAKIIEKPTHDWVYSPGLDIDCDEYFQLDDINEHFHETEKPFFVFDCDEERWPGIDIYEAINDSLLDFYDDAKSQITESDYNELKNFIDNWNKKQNVVQYVPNHDKIIILDKDRYDKFLNYVQETQ